VQAEALQQPRGVLPQPGGFAGTGRPGTEQGDGRLPVHAAALSTDFGHDASVELVSGPAVLLAAAVLLACLGQGLQAAFQLGQAGRVDGGAAIRSQGWAAGCRGQGRQSQKGGKKSKHPAVSAGPTEKDWYSSTQGSCHLRQCASVELLPVPSVP